MAAPHTAARTSPRAAPAAPTTPARMLRTVVTLDTSAAIALDDVLQFLEGEGFEGSADEAVNAMVRAHGAALDVVLGTYEGAAGDEAAAVFVAVHGAPLSERAACEMLGRLVHATTGDSSWLDGWDEHSELDTDESVGRSRCEEVV